MSVIRCKILVFVNTVEMIFLVNFQANSVTMKLFVTHIARFTNFSGARIHLLVAHLLKEFLVVRGKECALEMKSCSIHHFCS